MASALIFVVSGSVSSYVLGTRIGIHTVYQEVCWKGFGGRERDNADRGLLERSCNTFWTIQVSTYWTAFKVGLGFGVSCITRCIAEMKGSFPV